MANVVYTQTCYREPARFCIRGYSSAYSDIRSFHNQISNGYCISNVPFLLVQADRNGSEDTHTVDMNFYSTDSYVVSYCFHSMHLCAYGHVAVHHLC